MTTQRHPMTSIGYDVTSIDEIRDYAPAAFTSHEGPHLSNRYSFASTEELLHSFDSLGWKPTHARQNGASPYSRHMVRLNNEEFGYMKLKNDNVKPQIVLDNSLNGSSPLQIHMGLFRLVCTNGLVIAIPGMYTSVKLRHVGIKMEELKELMRLVSDQYMTVHTHIDAMQNFKLNADQSEEFVFKAMAAREPHMFIKEDGSIDVKKASSIINPTQILQPVRGEDKQEDLWTLFNIVQERLVKGDFERTTINGRKTNPRGINNASRNIDFNKKLWEVAESYMLPAEEKGN